MISLPARTGIICPEEGPFRILMCASILATPVCSTWNGSISCRSGLQRRCWLILLVPRFDLKTLKGSRLRLLRVYTYKAVIRLIGRRFDLFARKGQPTLGFVVARSISRKLLNGRIMANSACDHRDAPDSR